MQACYTPTPHLIIHLFAYNAFISSIGLIFSKFAPAEVIHNAKILNLSEAFSIGEDKYTYRRIWRRLYRSNKHQSIAIRAIRAICDSVINIVCSTIETFITAWYIYYGALFVIVIQYYYAFNQQAVDKDP